MITLTDGTTTVTLPDDFYWSDEHDWHPVEQNVERTITGALIVEAAARVGGRPITLQPEDESNAWIALADLAQLETWAATPGKELTLNIRGSTKTVMYRHHDNGGLTAKPVVHFSVPDSDDFYLTTIRLMEI